MSVNSMPSASGLDNSSLRGQGLSCALQGVGQRPWPLLPSSNFPSASGRDNQIDSRHCQMSPGRVGAGGKIAPG